MKKIILFFIVSFFFNIMYSQVNQPNKTLTDEVNLLQLEQKINHLKQYYRFLEKRFYDSLSILKQNVQTSIFNSNNSIEFYHQQMLQHIDKSEQRFASLEQTNSKILKRHNLHFTLLYIIFLILLLGIIFVYFYYSKFLKELDIFFQNQLQSTHQHFDNNLRELEENSKTLVSSLDKTMNEKFDEITNYTSKINASLESSIETLKNEIGTIENKLLQKTSQIEETLQKIQQYLSNHENLHKHNLSQIESIQTKFEETVKTINEKILSLNDKISQIEKIGDV